LEQRYVPDGWLGALCGNNIIYDFSVPVMYEDSLHGLMNGLCRQSVQSGTSSTISNSNVPSTINSSSSDSINQAQAASCGPE